MNLITNSVLAEKLGFPHSKTKRYAREFLSPDPMATIQSGYARKYDLDDAFIIYLGGYLVSFLKFSVPDAKIIINDLSPWLHEKGFFPLRDWGNKKKGEKLANSGVMRWEIHIERGQKSFSYQAKGILNFKILDKTNKRKDKVYQETYVIEEILPQGERERNLVEFRTLHITTLINYFTGKMGIKDS